MELMVNGSALIQTENKLGDKFANMYANTLTYNTRRAYVKDVMDFFKVTDIKDITVDMITNVNVATAQIFRKDLLDSGYALSTINRKMTALSNFYRVLCRREIGIMDFNPFDGSEGSVRVKQDKTYSNTRSLAPMPGAPVTDNGTKKGKVDFDIVVRLEK
jgi:site-specific recombinase XerC